MNGTAGGAKAPRGNLRAASRPITAYNTSAIVLRGTSETMVDPEFDEDTYTRSPSGDTLYCAGVQ